MKASKLFSVFTRASLHSAGDWLSCEASRSSRALGRPFLGITQELVCSVSGRT